MVGNHSKTSNFRETPVNSFHQSSCGGTFDCFNVGPSYGLEAKIMLILPLHLHRIGLLLQNKKWIMLKVMGSLTVGVEYHNARATEHKCPTVT